MLVSWCALRFAETVPTIRFEQEGQQVGCIEGANLRKAALDAGVNPYKSLNNLNNCSGVGQCGTCVMEVLEGQANLSPRSDVEEVYLADRPANFRLSCRTTVNGDVTVAPVPLKVWAAAPTAWLVRSNPSSAAESWRNFAGLQLQPLQHLSKALSGCLSGDCPRRARHHRDPSIEGALVLRSILGRRKLLFNTSGQSYRAMGAAAVKALSDDEAMDALAADGKLIKRPFVAVDASTFLTGFKPDLWESVLQG